jgi:hypothetical protein
MLCDWHQLDVAEPLFFDVGNQTIGKLWISEQAGTWLEVGRWHWWAWSSIRFNEWIVS